MTEPQVKHPHFGWAHGLPVHKHTTDHLPGDTPYQRFNKKLAVRLTATVGTMTMFWVFNGLSLLSLPATLALIHAIPNSWVGADPFTRFFLAFGFIYLITWICQNYIQLVLLPALMVGQNLQNAASDARAAKQFEDTENVKQGMETALDNLNLETEGGLKAIMDQLVIIKQACQEGKAA